MPSLLNAEAEARTPPRPKWPTILGKIILGAIIASSMVWLILLLAIQLRNRSPEFVEEKPQVPTPVIVKQDPLTQILPNEESPKPETLPSAFVIVCDSAPGKVIVLDKDGKWISTTKAVDVRFIIGHEATISVVIYEGIVKPSKPEIRVWHLAQLKSVSALEFQKMVDNLQTDPTAIGATIKE